MNKITRRNYLNQWAVVVIQKRPLQAPLWLHHSTGSDCTLFRLNECFGVESSFSSHNGHSQPAVPENVFESREVVTELALQTQLWPRPCLQPQEAPFALQFSIYRGCPGTLRVRPHWTIQMCLDWTTWLVIVEHNFSEIFLKGILMSIFISIQHFWIGEITRVRVRSYDG